MLPAVYGQSISPTAQQVLDDVWVNCERITPEAFPAECASVSHESPVTVVLGGDLLLTGLDGGYIENRLIWQAVDGFKAQGYSIDSVEQLDKARKTIPIS